jgi:hypothetical protein
MESSISSICSSCSCLSIIGVGAYFYMQNSGSNENSSGSMSGLNMIKKIAKKSGGKRGGRDRTDSSIKGDSSSDISNL